MQIDPTTTGVYSWPPFTMPSTLEWQHAAGNNAAHSQKYMSMQYLVHEAYVPSAMP
jgi:hypothetical protein